MDVDVGRVDVFVSEPQRDDGGACSSRMAAVWRSVCGGMFIVWVGRIALGFAILPSVQEQRQQRAVVRSTRVHTMAGPRTRS